MDPKKPAKKAPAKAGVIAVETPEQKAERKRAAARERVDAEKRWLENNMAGSGRLKGRPSLYVRPFWELSEHDIARFDRVHGVTKMLDQIRHNVHPVDQELVFNALGATVGFHELSKLIESMEQSDSLDDYRYELEHVRTGFELALRALDQVLVGRGIVTDALSNGGKSRASAKAMEEIKKEWTLLQAPGAKYPGDVQFAKKMHTKHGNSIRSERSIYNAIRKWRQGSPS